MDAALGEVIIDNMIYSARYAQPPRVAPDVHQEEEEEEDAMSHRRLSSNDAGTDRCHESRLVTTDLDEPILKEPDYINLPARLDVEENIYEEINELQKRRMALGGSPAVPMVTSSAQQQHHSSGVGGGGSLQVLEDEVARVHLSHDKTLNKLNLDFEQFLKPESPEPVIIPEVVPNHHHHQHHRSNSSVSVAQLMIQGSERASTVLTRCESLDMMMISPAIQRRPSVGSTNSTSSSVTSGSASQRSDTRQSLRQFHQGLQKGIQIANQGLVDFSEKCVKSLLLTKRSSRNKKVAAVNNDRRSTCESDAGAASSSPAEPGENCDSSQIYEDIDRTEVDSSKAKPTANGSDVDSLGSGEFESFSSDVEEELEGDKTHSPTTSSSSLRALLTGKSLRNKLRGGSRREEEKPALAAAASSPPPGERRFSRLFSLRRSVTASTLPSPTGSTFLDYGSSSGSVTELSSSPRSLPLPHLLEEDEMMSGLGLNNLFQRRHQPPALPPMPPNLNPEQIKRRYIVATLIHSENSYVATLQRLVNDYKKPLEESNPPILGAGKIATLFHRIPEILQCHTLFRLALADCARTWDKEERIGEVFVASFSKASVLDYYSDFINNFSLALDVARQESKRKSALADFLKVKQISSHDRLSFFGLMVKPVQRFPQFILLLQDLLKHTPQGHPDRMTLQLALTQLESLAELLNERKRESEQYQAFRETLRRVSGKFSLRPLADNNRYLLRQDNAHLVEFNQNGMISKTKERRLLLLNDLLVCVSVSSKSGDDYRNSSERLTLKWAFPITDVEVEDTSTSPTLSRLLSAGSSLRSSSSLGAVECINGVDNLCQEMNRLMHDYDVITRIGSLIDSLHGQYENLDKSVTRSALSRIQRQLQEKDEEMAWIDSCCLQLIVRNRSGKEEKFTFQTESPDIRKDWVIELRLAQLALDPKNSPSWDVPEQEKRPSTKMPLFVKSLPVYRSHHETEVRCGCFYTALVQKTGPSVRYLGPRAQNFLWVVTSDGISSHVTLLTSQQPVGPSLKEAGAFSLLEVRVNSVEFSPGAQLHFDNNNEDARPSERIRGDLVWLGTESRRILLYSAQEPHLSGQVGSLSLPASIVQLRYHWDQMWVALANGTVAIFKRNNTDGAWELNAPATLITLGEEPVVSLLPIGQSLYAACGRSVFVLDGITGESLRNFSVQQQDHSGAAIHAMAASGIGLWISLRQSSTICLYHTETFRHLQDINVASNVQRLLGNSKSLKPVYVTALMASRGLLWVGTNVGIALSIPLPRLEGVPIISGRANVSHHAHSGPITFFLTLQMPPKNPPLSATPSVMSTPSIPLPPSSCTIHEESETESPTSPLPGKGSSQLAPNTKPATRSASFDSPLMLPRMKPRVVGGDSFKRLSRTLPRGHVSPFTTNAESCDIFGLYGELMNVKDYEGDPDGAQSGGTPGNMMYETLLRRSDPDLAAIPAKVSTLDRRLHMKAARPRSLDLSNWSVDSRSSLYTTSSGSTEDSASHNTPDSTTSTLKKGAQHQNQTKKRNSGGNLSGLDAPRTVLTLSGGRGYLYPHQQSHHLSSSESSSSNSNERKNSVPTSPACNTNDAHIILWEMKL